MFTGIVTAMGTIVDDDGGESRRFTVQAPWNCADIAVGASVSCSGACLTAVGRTSDTFTVDVSGETRACTTLGDWSVGTRINLERSYHVGDEVGGHIVSGHVDAVVVVDTVRPRGESRFMSFATPVDLAPFIAEKGSVAVDGVSLTVNGVVDSGDTCLFDVNIIPHTLRETTLGNLAPGSRVNLEIDLFARYIGRMIKTGYHRRFAPDRDT